jgi:hypothetical protein
MIIKRFQQLLLLLFYDKAEDRIQNLMYITQILHQ